MEGNTKKTVKLILTKFKTVPVYVCGTNLRPFEYVRTEFEMSVNISLFM